MNPHDEERDNLLKRKVSSDFATFLGLLSLLTNRKKSCENILHVILLIFLFS
jgi:hypothetical protein